MDRVSLSTLNRLDRPAFTEALAGVFEHSPWVAERAHAHAPFADLDALHAAMAAIVDAAPRDEQLALIRAHPDLAGRAALAGTVTDDSKREQAGAGLDRLDPEAFARFERLNRAYREAFGFPFVLAVRGHDAAAILKAFERRLEHDPEEERRQALREIAAIARFRLEARIGG